jgi:hypothetical protein
MSKKLLIQRISLVVAVAGLFLLLSPARGQKSGKTGPPRLEMPPEVRKTAEAIQGTWLGTMVARVPGYPAESFEWTMTCQFVAQGAGASCTNTGKASIGSMSESCLLAFDPEGKSVHYMCVTSMGEVHDHKGKWKDEKTIQFEPLVGGMMGQQVTETNRWHFPTTDTIDKTSDIKLPDGSVMSFEFKGKRQ